MDVRRTTYLLARVAIAFLCAFALVIVPGCGGDADEADAAADAADVAASFCTMGTLDVNVTTVMDASVTVDDIVIPYIRPALSLMVAADLFNGQTFTFRRGRTMNDDFVDSATRLLQSLWNKQSQRRRPNNPVNLQSIRLLEYLNRLLCLTTIDAIRI